MGVGMPSTTPSVTPAGNLGNDPATLICARIRVSPLWSISEVNGRDLVTASAVRMRSKRSGSFS